MINKSSRKSGLYSVGRFSVVTEKTKENYGKFVILPLPDGFGQTVGNSLRRVLLSSLPGAAVTKVKIIGANHIFTTLKGVKEDLVEVVLSMKQVRFSYHGEKPITLKIEKKGPGEVKAKDIKLQPGVEVINPDLKLATLADKKTTFKMDLVVEKGVGYVTEEEHKSQKFGTIALDSVFTPIKKVAYKVEPVRGGKNLNLDKLTMEVWTDGTITPKEAIQTSASILREVFQQIVNPKATEPEVEKESKKSDKDLDLLIEEIGEIPLRLGNALKKAGYKKVSDLIEAGKSKLAKAKNIGGKSIDQLVVALEKRGMELK